MVLAASESRLTLASLEPRRLLRFNVQSSDVIQDSMRINVSEEHSDSVTWFKERFLSDEEIIEQIVHNPTSTILWTIHRPKRGWYIRLRSPTFPPGVFIPLTPVPQSSPHFVDAALSFRSRTSLPNANQFGPTSDDNLDSATVIHSYPPSPPAIVIDPPPPESIHAKLEEVATSPVVSPTLQPPSTQITQFILATHTSQETPLMSSSFFSRAMSLLKNQKPSQSNSFTLSRMPPGPNSNSVPYVSGNESRLHIPIYSSSAPLIPVLTFYDRTPVYTFRSFTGTIEIDAKEERALGIDTSFWIAVALTYLEFLEERESYLAVLSD